MAKSKKEFDKDLMYSKMMPSAGRGEEPAELAPAPIVAEPKEEENPLSQLRTRLFPQQNLFADFDRDGTHLVNLMENLVLLKLDQVFSKFNCCKCDRCKKDAAALALSKLPARYVVGTPSQLQRMANEVPDKDITAALIQAVLSIRSKPRH